MPRGSLKWSVSGCVIIFVAILLVTASGPILFAVLSGIAAWWIYTRNSLRRRFNLIGLGCLLPMAVVVGLGYGAFKFAEHRSRMNLMPADLEVTGIVYSEEENWGSVLLPLPGDNETGFLMYTLSDATANTIAIEGLDFFRRSENIDRRIGMQRTFTVWNETPMGNTISSYLNQFGFGIEIDPSVKATVDDAISKPGSFFCYGRNGLLIVIPQAKRAIFAYAG
jgi:hypothetical protein